MFLQVTHLIGVEHADSEGRNQVSKLNKVFIKSNPKFIVGVLNIGQSTNMDNLFLENRQISEAPNQETEIYETRQ